MSVVLGIAFTTGTLVLTDTMTAAFDDVIAATTDVDVAVRGKAAFTEQSAPGAEVSATTERQTVPPGLLDVVARVDGVAVAQPDISGYAQLIGADGEAIGGGGRPTIGMNAPVPGGPSGMTMRAGRHPQQAGEISIDASSAEQLGVSVGDDVTVLTPGPVVPAEVVGIFGYGELDTLAGATVTVLDLDSALTLYSPDGRYLSVAVEATDGVDADDLRHRIAAAVGDDYDVVTGKQLAEENGETVSSALGFFSTALLVFAGIALFVGGFLIFNTFTIIVAQRTREFALLRAVGAGRRQVLGTVLAEAGATGLLGAVAGTALGLVVAEGLASLMSAFGIDLPDAAVRFAPRTVLVALVLGIGVTTVAALLPALRATRVLPVEALRTGRTAAGSMRRRRAVVGAVMGLGGAAGVASGLGLVGDVVLPLVGVGALLLLVAVAVSSPLLVRPLVAVLGWPLARFGGPAGTLARDNALRNPRRTAATASALMIGVALVAFVSIFAASLKSSASATVGDVFLADLTLTTAAQGLSPDVAEDLSALPEVAVAMPQRVGSFRYEGKDLMTIGVNPASVEQVFAIPLVEGDVADLADGGVLVSRDVAETEGWATGEAIDVQFAATGATSLPVRGVFDGAGIDVDFVVDNATLAANSREQLDFRVLVALEGGVSVADGRTAVEEAVATVPTVQVLDNEELRAQITAQVDQLLGLVTVLLALSVLIALFGIVNTLGLSVLERVRELGLLRAVGMTRRQVRRMVRGEAVVIAVLGAVLGLAVGVLFGWITTTAMADQGVTRLVVPASHLTAAVVMAAVAGVLAAVLPARRASRLDVLDAIAAD